MIQIIADRWVVRWVAGQLKLDDIGDAEALGLVEDGKILAGFVYREYNGSSIELLVASTSPRWATKSTLFHMFYYPFVTLGCRRVGAMIASHNEKARDRIERLGFTLEGFHPEAMPDGSDAISYGLLRRDCRWIGNLNG